MITNQSLRQTLPCRTLFVSVSLLVLCLPAQLSAQLGDLSIYQIQYTADPSGNSPYTGQVVNCRGGIVTHKFPGYFPRLILQDPNFPLGWGAIPVKDPRPGAPLYNSASVGDWVRLVNVEVEESGKAVGNTTLMCYGDLNPSLTIVSTGNSLPEPLTLTLDQIPAPVEVAPGSWYVADHRAEPFEAMRVRIENVVVAQMGLGKANDNYLVQDVVDPNRSCWAADYMNQDLPPEEIYHPYVQLDRRFCRLEGILEQYTNIPNGFDYYQLITTATASFALPPETAAGNLNGDCIINLADLALFAQQWLRDDCVATNDYCSYADLNTNGAVNISDLITLAENWLLAP